MKTIQLWVLLSLTAVCYSCRKEVQQTPDGVIVNLTPKSKAEAAAVRLQVINDRIVRVSATPDKRFSTEPSLIILPREGAAPHFEVQNADSLVRLTTAELQVTVNKTTGAVNFMDHDGKPVLCEQQGGGKSFRAIEVEGTKGYELRQVFESPTDEAFYGLGQHQSDEFNYKGRNESLFQYNTKVSIPVVMSNKNYGILWDNYSLSRFGNPNDYQQLDECFTLYDANDKPGGLTAIYHSERGAQALIRRESQIFYEDLQSVKQLPQQVPLGRASVTYTGTMAAKASGTYHFQLYYAGYVKVFVGDTLLVPERWRTAWNPNAYKFSLDMKQAEKRPVRIEWKPDGGTSYLGLRALPPVSDDEQQKLSIFSEMGNEIDYYFMYGHSMDEVVSDYRLLTGKAPIMPKWAMGYWQSRERYKTQDELLATLKEFRRRQIPIDNIVLDWFYWREDDWGSHEFDKTRFPDPKGMVDSIHAMSAHLMISVWPKFYARTEHFKAFEKNGWMYMQAVKDSIRDWVGRGYIGSFYDAYADGARQLFWQQLKDHLYPLGIDAWWMDASEPNIRDCTDMPYRKLLQGPTALGPSTKYFNTYALMNAKAIYTGLREADPNRRVFQLTRSGFAGLQRYATATWSGDIGTRWEDMRAQIPAALNYSVAGLPYWTMDIGGFCVENRYVAAQHQFDATRVENADLKEWRELNARWYQFGAFCPIFRAHGQFPYREVFNIAPEGHPAYESIVYYTRLRYYLMPYIYALAGATYMHDYTIMRPLVMDFGADSEVLNIGHQYMFGTAFMVCPVTTAQATTLDVYFPANTTWYDLYSGQTIAGGQQLTVDAPYGRMPVYVRAGSIVPTGPLMQYVDEKPTKELTIYVYAGDNGNFVLYEDEGLSYNYEQGRYSEIPLTYDDATRTLTIGKRQGSFEGMNEARKFNVIYLTPEHPQGFEPERARQGISVDYKGEEVKVVLK